MAVWGVCFGNASLADTARTAKTSCHSTEWQDIMRWRTCMREHDTEHSMLTTMTAGRPHPRRDTDARMFIGARMHDGTDTGTAHIEIVGGETTRHRPATRAESSPRSCRRPDQRYRTCLECGARASREQHTRARESIAFDASATRVCGAASSALDKRDRCRGSIGREPIGSAAAVQPPAAAC